MTLRARLTAAFLAVVLGPVLLGALFVGGTVAQVGRARAVERLDSAATTVRTVVDGMCQRLRTAAQTAALLTVAGREPDAARRPVDNRLATTVVLTGADGTPIASAGAAPPTAWADCAGPAPDRGYTGFGARVEMRDPRGAHLGYATAIDPLDEALVQRLATAGAAAVTVLSTVDRPLSTESGVDREGVASAAGRLRPGAVAETDTGRYVRRLDPEAGQPLRLALTVAPQPATGLLGGLVAVVGLAGALAVVAAWWLARSTTQPLTELAHAADRVAGGDLAARVPVRSADEVGRLAATFNRMTREMRGYVRALTASRDQMRGQLALLGDTLSSTHNVPRILEMILQTARAATGAQAGVVLLFDPATRTLVARCADGPIDVSRLRLKPGEGLLGAVASSGVAVRGRLDRDRPALAPTEPVFRSYIAVPFVAPATPDDAAHTAQGVLALYGRLDAEEFDEPDVVMLRRFAGQAAVALDNVRAHEEMQRLSLTDPLTGLFNYRYLTESVRREVERANRFGRMLAVLAMDLDYFKEVNDSYGHAAGDAVLAEFAGRIRGMIREVDFAFRQGGEEFVVLLPETDAAGGAALAQRLGAAVRRTPVTVTPSPAGEPIRIPVTVSIGIAVYPDHGITGPAVLKAADDALYAAKAAGRNTYRVAGVPAGASRTAQPPRQTRGG